jgi:RimJ/RimL family protein N-acetyltransferase
MRSTLVTKRLRLRPVEPADQQLLFQWRNDTTFMNYVLGRRKIVGWDQFQGERRSDASRYMELIITETRTGRPIGLVYNHDLDQANGRTFVSVFVIPECRTRGYGLEAAMMLASYLFIELRLHKVCFSVLSSNAASRSVMEGAGLTCEALLREHMFLSGRWHDLMQFSILRRETKKKFEPMLRRLVKGRKDKKKTP